jgi:NADPH:quinone reductase-like Zn-dependent oxidoreductase
MKWFADVEGRPTPETGRDDVRVAVHAWGSTPAQSTCPGTLTGHLGVNRTPELSAREVAGVIAALGCAAGGLSVGQRVFGLAAWGASGDLAEGVSVQARNLAPLPSEVDFMVGASLPISGLTAWQGLFVHGRFQPGQSLLIHGAGGRVGSMVAQLAHEAGAYIIGTGHAGDRQTALDSGVQEFIDLDIDVLEEIDRVDLVFDVLGGDIGRRSVALVRTGGMLVTTAGPPEVQPLDGLAIDFVVEADRSQLCEIVQRVRDGRLRTNIGNTAALHDDVAAFNPSERVEDRSAVRGRP